jgi:protein TonB
MPYSPAGEDLICLYMRSFKTPSFCKTLQCTKQPGIILLLLLSTTFCPAQVTCTETLITETDTVTSESIIRARKNIVVSEDGGKTGFAFFGLLMDSTFILTIRTAGGGACVNTGDAIHFVFADSSRLELNHMGTFNCEAKTSLYSNQRFDNIDLLEILMQENLAQITVWTKKRSITRNVSEKSAMEMRELLACFNSVRGESTFSSLVPDKVFVLVELQPDYIGGYEEMMNFVMRHLRYPASARQAGAEGTVFVQFLVNKDGSLSDIETIRSVHPALDAEAERVIELMPPWKPGRQKGKPVTVRFVLPIKFKLG